MAPTLVWGEEGEETLELFSAYQDSSSSATRATKPLSQSAENITIVTAKEIEALNAHTLADVLATVPGVQVQFLGGPGGVTVNSIQGSNSFHLLVMVDGVALNSLGENFSDIGMVPARIIERIEIVKGAASSAWGQALGGVINVITKSPEPGTITGSITASIGSRTTTGDSIELSGSRNGIGYYLYGGYLGSDGIQPHTSTHAQNAHVKLTYELQGEGLVWGTFDYTHANRGNFFAPDFDLQEDATSTYIYATLGVRKKLTDRLELEISGRHAYRGSNFFDTRISDGSSIEGSTRIGRDKVYGGGAKLIWRGDNNLLVAGAEYEHGEMALNRALVASDALSAIEDHWGVFLNDTITLGDLTLIPGARFDHANITSNQFSPSFGVTYRLNESTLLRGYTGRGYNIISLGLLSQPPEKVWTSQIGIESSIVPYLWQKLTLLRNETWDIRNSLDRHIAMGAEYEIRTTPVFNTSIGAGYTFTDTRVDSTGSQAPGIPRHTVQLALRYEDQTYRGLLTGRHIFWNPDPRDTGRYQGLIWDLHLGATLLRQETRSLELFFSGHNLFNGSQTNTRFFPSPGRWFEGGMRIRF